MSASLSPSERQRHEAVQGLQPRPSGRPVVVLVAPSVSYRLGDFTEAAAALRIDTVVATDAAMPMGHLGTSRSIAIDFTRPEWSAARIAKLRPAPDAVLAVDDVGVVIAAQASDLLGLRSNSPDAVSLTRDKAHMRRRLDAHGVPQPRYRVARRGLVADTADEVGYPCVVKPRGLSASRGVLRVNDRKDAAAADERVRSIVAQAGGDPEVSLLVERFIPGPEVAVEGVIVDGKLSVLALLDKPDPLDGPYFEETLFVTPSRLPVPLQEGIIEITADATAALGLSSGPVHAEVRCGTEGVVLIEIAARSIGGLCGRALTFGLLGETLESVLIRSAVGMPGSGTDPAAPASGVMMIPIVAEGELLAIDGVDDVLAVDGITGFDQTIPSGTSVVPLPEGDRYLGFLFARGATPDEVETALRRGWEKLTVEIDRRPLL